MIAASAMIVAHVITGTAGLVSGTVALWARKGGKWHRQAGQVFFATMILMGLSGALLAALEPERISVTAGILAAYLTATAWVTVRRRPGEVGLFEYAAFCIGAACAVADLMFGLEAAASPSGSLDGYPAPIYYAFAGVAGLAALLDLRVIAKGGLAGTARLARHLWRMCFALFLAAASFFLGQQDEFPAALQGWLIWFVPPVAVLALMTFWLGRVHFMAWRRRPKRKAVALHS